jgi:hypothetical protein
VELTVGDSGVGVPESLTSNYRLKGHPAPIPAVPDDEAWEERQVLAWALDKSSTRHVTARRGTRGLYRLNATAQKYAGCITLRSERSFVGCDYGRVDDTGKWPTHPYIVSQAKLARSPGTVVHVRIPDLPPQETLSVTLSRGDAGPAEFNVLNFADVDFREGKAAVEKVQRDLQAACDKTSQAKEHPQAVLADFGFADIGDRELLEYFLSSLRQLAKPALVVVANLGYRSGDQLEAIVDSISEDAEAEIGVTRGGRTSDAGNPFLIRRCDGRYIWVGLPRSRDRGLCDGLLAREVLTATEIEDRFPKQENLRRFLDMLAEYSHVILPAEGGGVRLAVSKLTLDQRLEESEQAYIGDVRDALLTQIDRLFPASGDVILTPSTEIVSRFIDLGALLAEVGLERVGYALARKTVIDLRRALTAADDDRPGTWQTIEVVADARVMPELVDRYSYLLERQLPNARVIPVRLTPWDRPSFEDGSYIILLSDLVQSLSTVRRVLGQMVRARRMPDAIVNVIEARPGEAPKPLFYGRDLDTVTLVAVDVQAKDADGAQPTVYIGPTDLKPEREIPDPLYPVGRETLDLMVRGATRGDVGSIPPAFFAHVITPEGRHFCYYIDVNQLLETVETTTPAPADQSRPSIMSFFRSAIDRWRDGREVHALCYPSNVSQSAARTIVQQLSGSKGPAPTAIPISPNWSRADLAPADFREPGKRIPFERVVLIDWGCLTGRSIQDYVRVLAEAGARDILVVVFLSHGSSSVEAGLRALRRVEIPDPQGSPHVASIAVEFLARLRTPAYDPPSCPHCQQMARLETEERFYPTDLLRDYLPWAKRNLRGAGLEGLRRDPSVHELPDIVALAELRDLIEDAQYRTRSRKKLRDKLEAMEADPTPPELNADLSRLMRLLAAEWTLLKQPCLSLPRFKDILARLAAKAIVCDNALEDLRRYAIVVLRTSSKTAFANLLPELFKALRKREPLLQQLLYCAFTYIQRDYQVSGVIEPLLVSLRRVRRLLRRAKMTDDDSYVPSRVSRTAHALYNYAEYQWAKLYRQEQRKRTAYDLWQELVDKAIPRWDHHADHGFASTLWNLCHLNQHCDPQIWALDRLHWYQSEKFMSRTLLPLMGSLRDIFNGLSEGAFAQLEQIQQGAVSAWMAEMTRHLDRFAASPDLAGDLYYWRAFTAVARRLWNGFFTDEAEDGAAEGADGGEERPAGEPRSEDTGFAPEEAPLFAEEPDDEKQRLGSTLFSLIQGCPTELWEDVRIAMTTVRGLQPTESYRGRPPQEVFCHTIPLIRSLREVFQNIPKHNTAKSGETIPVEVTVSEDGQRTVITVRNGGSERRPREPGTGLERCRERLDPYGGVVRPRKLEGQDWTFEVTISLVKWGC